MGLMKLLLCAGMLNWRHSSTFLALVRDQSQARNRVTIDWQGNIFFLTLLLWFNFFALEFECR